MWYNLWVYIYGGNFIVLNFYIFRKEERVIINELNELGFS